MMLGIGIETAIFFYAGLSGCIIFIFYQVLVQIRKLVKHSITMVNVEDFFFWIGVGIYLFRQMYRTTYGTIRWFFVLGVILGSVSAWLIKRVFNNLLKNM